MKNLRNYKKSLNYKNLSNSSIIARSLKIKKKIIKNNKENYDFIIKKNKEKDQRKKNQKLALSNLIKNNITDHILNTKSNSKLIYKKKLINKKKFHNSNFTLNSKIEKQIKFSKNIEYNLPKYYKILNKNFNNYYNQVLKKYEFDESRDEIELKNYSYSDLSGEKNDIENFININNKKNYYKPKINKNWINQRRNIDLDFLNDIDIETYLKSKNKDQNVNVVEFTNKRYTSLKLDKISKFFSINKKKNQKKIKRCKKNRNKKNSIKYKNKVKFKNVNNNNIVNSINNNNMNYIKISKKKYYSKWMVIIDKLLKQKNFCIINLDIGYYKNENENENLNFNEKIEKDLMSEHNKIFKKEIKSLKYIKNDLNIKFFHSL